MSMIYRLADKPIPTCSASWRIGSTVTIANTNTSSTVRDGEFTPVYEEAGRPSGLKPEEAPYDKHAVSHPHDGLTVHTGAPYEAFRNMVDKLFKEHIDQDFNVSYCWSVIRVNKINGVPSTEANQLKVCLLVSFFDSRNHRPGHTYHRVAEVNDLPRFCRVFQDALAGVKHEVKLTPDQTPSEFCYAIRRAEYLVRNQPNPPSGNLPQERYCKREPEDQYTITWFDQVTAKQGEVAGKVNPLMCVAAGS
ncbi:hypothetical protein GGR57DRAFT_507419 [Xylariaceae sp. FL1272]|nr:hypothetical protein GGR57DRAFT_507419 [Xylariaceae sp. FL1272]